MRDLQILMNEIDSWAASTFGPNRSPVPVIHHLKKEATELIEALIKYENMLKQKEFSITNPALPNMLYEFSDCLILLLNAAGIVGISADFLIDLAQQKIEICKQREWGAPDVNGVIEHIRTKEEKLFPGPLYITIDPAVPGADTTVLFKIENNENKETNV